MSFTLQSQVLACVSVFGSGLGTLSTICKLKVWQNMKMQRKMKAAFLSSTVSDHKAMQTSNY